MKGAAGFSAEVAKGSPAEAAGGLGQYRPTVIPRMGWSAIEEQGALCLPASCFFPARHSFLRITVDHGF